MVLVKRLLLRSQLHQKKVSIKRGTSIGKSKTYIKNGKRYFQIIDKYQHLIFVNDSSTKSLQNLKLFICNT